MRLRRFGALRTARLTKKPSAAQTCLPPRKPQAPPQARGHHAISDALQPARLTKTPSAAQTCLPPRKPQAPPQARGHHAISDALQPARLTKTPSAAQTCLPPRNPVRSLPHYHLRRSATFRPRFSGARSAPKHSFAVRARRSAQGSALLSAP